MKGYISVVGWLVGSRCTLSRRGGGGGGGEERVIASSRCLFLFSARACVYVLSVGPTGCHTTYGTAKRMDRNERVYMDSTRS